MNTFRTGQRVRVTNVGRLAGDADVFVGAEGEIKFFDAFADDFGVAVYDDPVVELSPGFMVPVFVNEMEIEEIT